MEEIKLFDVVKVLVAIPSRGIAVGAVGTVIDALAKGAFEVEFEDVEAETGEMVTVGLAVDKLKLVSSYGQVAGYTIGCIMPTHRHDVKFAVASNSPVSKTMLVLA